MAKRKGNKKWEKVNGFPVREIRPGYWLVDFMRDGKRVRKAFDDRAALVVYCAAKKRELINMGTRALDLPDDARMDAVKALEFLRGTGASLLDAAREYATRHPATAGETFRQTCDRYLADMVTSGCRKISIDDKRRRLAAVCRDLGDRATVGIDAMDVDRWLEGRGYGPVTVNAYKGSVATVLRFQAGKKRQRRNDARTPPTWPAETVATIMEVAERTEPAAVPALALLFFAGIRPQEVLRLSWRDIDIAAGHVMLTAEATKTRNARRVDLQDNAVAWLAAYRRTDGLVAPTHGALRGMRERIMAAAKLTDWPVDVARHTFATCLLASIGDASAVATQLGHYGTPATFARFYKGAPRTKEQAAAYWAIKPNEGTPAAIRFRRTAAG